MRRIAATTLGCMVLAVLAPWAWATVLVVLVAPIFLGLWLVASLTDDRLRVLPHGALAEASGLVDRRAGPGDDG